MQERKKKMNSREKSKSVSALSIWSFMDWYQIIVVVIDQPDGHCITQSTRVKYMLSILATSIWLIHCVLQFHMQEIELWINDSHGHSKDQISDKACKRDENIYIKNCISPIHLVIYGLISNHCCRNWSARWTLHNTVY